MSYYNKNWGQGEERPWNFAELLLTRCDNLFQKANEGSIEANANVWYRVLRSIKRTISFTDNIDTKKKTSLNIVNENLKKVRNKLRLATKTPNEILYLDIEEDLEKIEEELIAIMYEHGLYYPKREFKSWEDEFLEEDV